MAFSEGKSERTATRNPQSRRLQEIVIVGREGTGQDGHIIGREQAHRSLCVELDSPVSGGICYLWDRDNGHDNFGVSENELNRRHQLHS